MSEAVSRDRWRTAQAAEQEYWHALASDPVECARIVNEKVDVAAWLENRCPSIALREVAEIGIGPLGMGCCHFLKPARRVVVGIEPLPLLDPERLGIAAPLTALVKACRDATTTYLQVPGEATALEEGRFDLVISYNVLDHVRDPRAVLTEARRILASDGFLLLGCDTVSLFSDARFRWVERRYPNSVGVRAHPFRFRLSAVERLVRACGFRIVARDSPRHRRLSGLVGRAHRLLVLAVPDVRLTGDETLEK